MRAWPAASWFFAVTLGGATAHAAHGRDVYETKHYLLHSIGGAVNEEDCAAILEQAWPVFQSFFRVEPETKGKSRLRIEVFPGRDTWLAGPHAGGTPPPAGLETTWFDRDSRVAYVCRSESEYETRKRVIYVACQQFHACSKTKNLDLDTWYVHGLAESFATHAWDGEKLTLAASPRISILDHPARAREALGGDKIGLDAFDERRLDDPSVRWAAVRFAMQGAGGKHRARFDKFALGHHGSKVSGEDFLRGLGRAESISQEFAEWLDSVQLPFEVLSGGWEDLLDGRIVCRTFAPHVALACARRPVSTLQYSLRERELNSGCTLGVVLEAASARDYRMFRLRPPHAMVERYADGELVSTGELLPFEGYDSDLVAIEATCADGAVTINADGRLFGPFPVEKPRLGIAIRDGPITLQRLQAH